MISREKKYAWWNMNAIDFFFLNLCLKKLRTIYEISVVKIEVDYPYWTLDMTVSHPPLY